MSSAGSKLDVYTATDLHLRVCTCTLLYLATQHDRVVFTHTIAGFTHGGFCTAGCPAPFLGASDPI